ncbi:MAG: hypothetical protein C4538_04140 [Nitrospiraceae bacterium]|nr:MAG: hypothetical protein C4538_04140 [Nitrospiraceae bacterium]
MEIRKVREMILLFFTIITLLSLGLLSAHAQDMTIDTNGNVGIGTTGPNTKLEINANGVTNGGAIRISGLPSSQNTLIEAAINGGAVGMKIQSAGSVQEYFMVTDSNSHPKFTVDTSYGKVGIGTDAPDATLHVIGDAHMTGELIVDGNIAAKYQDLAEWVRTSEPLTKGTVVMIDLENNDQVLPSDMSYNTLVAGVVSEAPGIVLGEKADNKAIIAHTGRVKVKVDTNFGAISRGDLLVTSPVKGYAMKADADKLKPGMLLGKALEPLKEGQKREILVLITLQ